ncbi:MAG: DUF2626 domain-containing protein [Exiguobacterium sp.]|uniref:DUF2626 domain-containing protein n=1 Tax=Exiguobacterium alkaliphilum TaxID=1428684 RepID=A0ABT2KYQ2_9BACL|nr:MULTISPECIES: DUF2626 domain-containing protein [Exiguobacterium]MDX5323717.1 DUF2626 domain-containing protein [Exiguobacterium sp.]KDN58769.1 membrane protein [Exiguobacterium sp. AB2]MCT4795591.1 DUF2626 domain-containing protein [Exiguobacterium alkaliphilum]MDX5425525.1 DUF2626 domain-containing protein [Exiguobacterium sp.]MDX6772934.1 DUF2626 domain-containing protein [Exiguobacterium sp.]
MARMYRVLGFWTGLIAALAFVGALGGDQSDSHYTNDFIVMGLVFLAQTIFFVALGYLKLTEKTYVYVFGAYLTVFFIVFTYWSNFQM